MKKRVVVTGVGVVTPLGCDSQTVWSRLLAGHSGIKRLSDIQYLNIQSKVAAKVLAIDEDKYGLDLQNSVSIKDQRRMDRFIQLSLEAAKQAIEQSNWVPMSDHQKQRTATIVGSSLGGFNGSVRAVRMFEEKGPDYVSPFTIPSFLLNLAAGQISIKYNYKGPLGAPASACAASAQAIGEGFKLIQNDEVDVAVCGGSEACIDPVILAAFVAAKAVSTSFNDDPETACRPFNSDRDGFVLGEGAAILVLESMENALERGATPLAEIVGYGTTSDAYHVTCCHDNGDALQRAMKLALKMAKITPDHIGYINAHATSTPLGDRAEMIAIKDVFGDSSKVSISSTKSATGHLLGAAGSLEAVLSILALKESCLPPTLNLTDLDSVAGKLDYIGPNFQRKNIEYAMTNSAGFGGVNASIVLRKWESSL